MSSSSHTTSPYEVRVYANYAGLKRNEPILCQNFRSIEDFTNISGISQKNRSVFESLMVPVRTNNFRNFCEDFFLPTFINQALKCNNVALKIIYSIAYIICDVCTLPIRLITAIPHYLYNAPRSKKESHRFYQYLINNKVPREKLSADHVYLEAQEKVRAGRACAECRKQKWVISYHVYAFNFIQLPHDPIFQEQRSWSSIEKHNIEPVRNFKKEIG